MLVIENLVKVYGNVRALDGLNLSIEKGHIYGFVGANGAGKTTAMKIVAGLLKPTSGSVTVDGVQLSKDTDKIKSKIGYMPDFFGVYDNLKVSEYMGFYAAVYRIPKEQRGKIIDQYLELVNLADKKDAYVDTLSRGMKQRLCLTRSLIHDPELLILDEPASGLDPRSRAEIKEILKELRGMGKTILISSHILSELAEMCTSVGIIDKGKMITSGTVDEIMNRASANRFIKIKVLGDIAPAIRYLTEKPEFVHVIEAYDYIGAEFMGNNVELAEILREMTAKGIKVFSFTEQERNLESVFLNVTGGLS
ncbi:MAG: ABC transporter ATP-binding protein [Eubacteriales bacterium]|nr:ABC transporter ATP-binding protein [Eubacteriales bacterium]